MPAISLLLLEGIQGTERSNEDLNAIAKRSFNQNEMVKTIFTALTGISSTSLLLRRIVIF